MSASTSPTDVLTPLDPLLTPCVFSVQRTEQGDAGNEV
jgi:hypothetical protein